jgi:hypothetical protein
VWKLDLTAALRLAAESPHSLRVCNLCSLTKGQAAIRDWFRARHDRTDNLPLFPDQLRRCGRSAQLASAKKYQAEGDLCQPLSAFFGLVPFLEGVVSKRAGSLTRAGATAIG